MKTNKERDQEQNKKRKLRRFTLNRETIQALDEPALLEVARGGMGRTDTICLTGCV